MSTDGRGRTERVEADTAQVNAGNATLRDEVGKLTGELADARAANEGTHPFCEPIDKAVVNLGDGDLKAENERLKAANGRLVTDLSQFKQDYLNRKGWQDRQADEYVKSLTRLRADNDRLKAENEKLKAESARNRNYGGPKPADCPHCDRWAAQAGEQLTRAEDLRADVDRLADELARVRDLNAVYSASIDRLRGVGGGGECDGDDPASRCEAATLRATYRVALADVLDALPPGAAVTFRVDPV